MIQIWFIANGQGICYFLIKGSVSASFAKSYLIHFKPGKQFKSYSKLYLSIWRLILSLPCGFGVWKPIGNRNMRENRPRPSELDIMSLSVLNNSVYQ